MRYTLLSLSLLVAACGGNTGTQPPPPPPAGIARVVLLTDKGVVFTGKALPGQQLVAQVIDSAGQVVTSNFVLTANASAGWTVKGDTVIAPATEGFGTVSITATRADPSEATSTDATVASTFNLTALNLKTGGAGAGTGGVMCRVDVAAYKADGGGTWYNYQGPKFNNFPIDSVLVDYITVDSVNYAGNGDWRLNQYTFSGSVYWHSPQLTYFLDDETGNVGGGPKAAGVGGGFIGLVSQVPDSFTITNGIANVTAARKGSIPTYAFNGFPFCSVANDAIHPGAADDITLTAQP